MKKNGTTTKKLIKIETTILVSAIALVVGFLGGVVFSAFKMGNTIPSTSGMTASREAENHQSITAEQENQIATLEKAARASEDADAWVALGNACFDYNLPEKAIDAYKTALTYQPDNANVWTDLGIMYRQIGESQEAIAMFEKAQKVSPGHEMSLFNKGIVLMHDMNDMSGALAAWQKLLQINPSATAPGGMPISELVERLKNSQP